MTGTISPVGDSDTWTFAANTGEAIVIRVGEITQSGSFTPRIRLKDPSAVLLATASGSVAAEIAVHAASSGIFTVIVDDAIGTTATGTYRLTLAETGAAVVVSPGDEDGPLTNGALQTGTIDVGDLDVWTLTTAGGPIVMNMGVITGGSTPLHPWLRIYSPTGALLGSSSGSAAASVAVTATTGGTYLVVAGDFFNANLGGFGTYWLSAAGSTAVPQVVAPGRPTAWALSPVAPNPLRMAGRVSFDVPQHAQVRLALLDLAGREVDVLSHGELEPGRYNVSLDIRSRAPGVYFLRLESSGVRMQRAVVLIR